ncbi:NAD(P)H-hydrate dehydratase [Marinimicrobium alkaliphilum]|uniref:NAD(P)H-hydrate dehydratase n=1 Tax=Marinimicrobium alkaliphilum TaxID=2202654 RepID=UPI000DB93D78|nr:NAD(P)H-hydrate dehydratase [Marinimicrobium alkaliphilum]
MTTALYTADQVRALDQAAIAAGIPAIHLMKRAGRAAFEQLLKRFGSPSELTVYCGAGNNAGDGYVIAALAAQRRLSVRIVQVGDPARLSAEARQAYEFACQEQVPMAPLGAAPTQGAIVDALLGTGLKGPVRDDYVPAIEQINASGLPVLAVDIPSGLNADTGCVEGVAVKAGVTVTFIGLKQGLLTGRGPALCGELVLRDLSVPDSIYAQVPASLEGLALGELLAALPERAADAHKGDFGHVMIIGGDTGYGGAALIAAEAAARSGAGLVSIATRPEHVPAMLVRCPEVMACGVTSGQELEPWLARPTVLVIGPGLGRSPWSEQMLQQAANSGLPMVVDADALNLLAEGRVVPGVPKRDNWVLTPHPGEAARLLGQGTADVQADRIKAVSALQARFGGAVILKGVGSLVAAGGTTGLVTDGNPGMASGGMGDLLSGLLGGLMAQGLSVTDAARLGAVLHASAADLAAAETGQRSLLATDLLPYVCQLLSVD